MAVGKKVQIVQTAGMYWTYDHLWYTAQTHVNHLDFFLHFGLFCAIPKLCIAFLNASYWFAYCFHWSQTFKCFCSYGITKF